MPSLESEQRRLFWDHRSCAPPPTRQNRMACAKCNFYLPKNSSQAQLIEGKANLLQLRQEIPLNDAELAAVDDGVAAMQKLMDQLVDVPTPAGPTPRELGLVVDTAGS